MRFNQRRQESVTLPHLTILTLLSKAYANSVVLDTNRTHPYGPRAFLIGSCDFNAQKGADRCWTRMAEDDPDSKRLTELQDRLQKARGKEAVPPQHGSQSQLALAFRLVAHLLAGGIVAGA